MCTQVQHGTEAYEETVALRSTVLRVPLGLVFSAEELAGERDSFHLAYRYGNALVACVVLKPLTDRQIRMRQLAVREDFRHKGIGRALVKYSEALAREHGYKEIVLHAREAAVDFYRNAGYEVEGERFIEVTVPHFAMRKSVD